eukprot:jgi/Ulvmu1/10260/UM060_0061.1
MSCVTREICSRMRESSSAVLRTPIAQHALRHCSTTQSSTASTAATTRAPRRIYASLNDVWQRVSKYGEDAKAPETVKQLAEAAGHGRLFRVLGIHSNNLWLRFGGIIVAFGCAGATYTVYKGTQSVYSFIMGVRDNSWAFNAIIGGAALGLAGYGMYRHQFLVSPTAVHRHALDVLRRDPAVQDVLRLPLTPGKPVLSIVDGGQVHLKWGILPRWRSQRIQMTFPVTGGANSGVVMVEAKKRWGRHLLKVLAVDVPSKAPLGKDTRLYVRGGVEGAAGAALPLGRAFEEMRVPMQKVMAARQELDREDEADDRELRAAERERAARVAAERAARAPKPLDEGGGMYVYEQMYWRAYYGARRLGRWMRGGRSVEA